MVKWRKAGRQPRQNQSSGEDSVHLGACGLAAMWLAREAGAGRGGPDGAGMEVLQGTEGLTVELGRPADQGKRLKRPFRRCKGSWDSAGVSAGDGSSWQQGGW